MAIEYEDTTTASVNRAAHVAACEAYADQVERLALSLNTRDPDILAEALWAEDCPGQSAGADLLVHLACDVQDILGDDAGDEHPQIPAWDNDLPLPPTRPSSRSWRCCAPTRTSAPAC